MSMVELQTEYPNISFHSWRGKRYAYDAETGKLWSGQIYYSFWKKVETDNIQKWLREHV